MSNIHKYTKKSYHDQHIKYSKQQNTKKLSWSTTDHITIHVKCKMSPLFVPEGDKKLSKISKVHKTSKMNMISKVHKTKSCPKKITSCYLAKRCLWTKSSRACNWSMLQSICPSISEKPLSIWDWNWEICLDNKVDWAEIFSSNASNLAQSWARTLEFTVEFESLSPILLLALLRHTFFL